MPILTSNSLAAYLPNFLLSRFKRYPSCYIHRLSLDIYVDHIFIYLSVEEILCLRRVSKVFFLLTHEPVIWKRFLSYLNIPIPPLRPTFRYALEATDFEVEQLVSRAISLEDNWRKMYPKITRTKVLLAHHEVLNLKILPGGKYLIASVRDTYRFFLVVFCLDHPQGPHALARVPTLTKAFNLQAKYMQYHGKQVIMVAYVRRSFEAGGPANQDPSEYSSQPEVEIDPPHPLVHELVCVQISLDALDAVSNPQIIPGGQDYISTVQRQKGPFFQVTTLVATHELDTISLYDTAGMPYVNVVQQPSHIVIIDLTNETISTLICSDHESHPGKPHRIRVIRNLPHQRELLVIRTITLPENSYMHILELYEMPSEVGTITHGYPKAEYHLVSECEVAAFHISDYGIPTTNDKNCRLRRDYQPPPPISVFMETVRPNGIKHYIIWPSIMEIPATATHGPLKGYFYALDHVCPQTNHQCAPLFARVLPGAYRSLIYTVHESDRKDVPSVVNLRRYVNPEFQHEGYPIPRVPRSSRVLRRKHPPLPVNTYSSLDIGSPWQQHLKNGGLAAITWDEGIGRLCLTSGGSDEIEILDFAHAVQPDKRFEQWKKSQGFILHDRYDTASGLPLLN